ncbi:MAG TPA: bifunctional phosphoribosylaminoimidazolecarboxamide formyltransferase/IMP cyclohydrolase [Bryobacteraceae bacterium]|nr:bifunctional phosphoribosylaminoimidazolecarboxamide formyltransferase/IMP cyclohydrolase [Bryobacteraceae bacterium]
MAKIQRALLSVTDKTGIVDFARRLSEFGVELISTGGTAKLLRESDIPVRDVSEVTGFPEMLDGRVKTMHPRITGGILAIRSKAEHAQALAEHGIAPIDMVVVNLYQFEKTAAKAGVTLDEMIENIDIGGPTMIRSAAKNFHDVAVVVSPEDYPAIAEEMREHAGSLTRETQWQLAQKAFRTTAAYDSAITLRLAQVNGAGPLPPTLNVHAKKIMDLRYGENPHQAAALYGARLAGIAGAEQLHGKELSYNNLVDLDAAWQLVNEFTAPAAAIIKHTNPAGCAEQGTLAEAYRKALECDPVSAFGGVIGLNRQVDEETARELAKLFVEAIAAPGYSASALEILKAKKNLRLMKVAPAPEGLVIKSISGGFLAQTADTHHLDRDATEVKTQRAPSEAEWVALDFAWKVAKHVKSNAIVYARAGQAVGVGAGQMSRVDSVKIGAMKAVLPLAGTVVASDAFFPFPDGVEEAASRGVTAIIQPGGSVRDAEVIAAADRLNLAMVFTGVRHFRH